MTDGKPPLLHHACERCSTVSLTECSVPMHTWRCLLSCPPPALRVSAPSREGPPAREGHMPGSGSPSPAASGSDHGSAPAAWQAAHKAEQDAQHQLVQVRASAAAAEASAKLDLAEERDRLGKALDNATCQRKRADTAEGHLRTAASSLGTLRCGGLADAVPGFRAGSRLAGWARGRRGGWRGFPRCWLQPRPLQGHVQSELPLPCGWPARSGQLHLQLSLYVCICAVATVLVPGCRGQRDQVEGGAEDAGGQG